MTNTGKFILVIAMISHLDVVHGISMPQKSSMPSLTVTPSSNSIQASWEKLGSWISSSVFIVSISIPDSVVTKEFICEGGPGTKCVYDTEDFSDHLPACTPVEVTVEASGVVAGPHITTTLSPDPLNLSVAANDRNLYINWDIPVSCEKSSKLIIKTRDLIVYEEVFSVPKSSYTYELSNDISTCDVLEVLVKTVNSDGESRGLKRTFLYAELKELSVNRIDSSNLNLVWEKPSCVLKTEVSWYDTSYSPSSLIGRDEVAATSLQVPAEDGQNLTLCIKPKGRFDTRLLDGGEICVDVAEFSGRADPPTLILTPHYTYVNVTFIRLEPWDNIEDYTLVIYKGTNNNGEELCNQPFKCDKKFCSHSSCNSLPVCTDVFVEVFGYDDPLKGSTKTLCEATTMTTADTTSATKTTSTEPTTVTAPTTTIHTTTPTSTTPITTKSTTTPATTTITTPSTAMSTTTTPTTTVPTTTTSITITPEPTESTTTPATTTITTSTTMPTTTTLTTTVPTTTASTTITPEPTDPNVDVRTSSDSVTVTWYRKGVWLDIENFHITITGVDSYINDHSDIRADLCSVDFPCNSTQCSFDSSTECPNFLPTPCSEVSVTVSGGESSEPAVTAEIAPESPSEISIQLSRNDVNVSWTLPPLTCQTSSRIMIKVTNDVDEDIDKVNEIISVPYNTYSYTSSSDLVCDVGQATVTSIGKDGESEGTSEGFLLTELKKLRAIRESDSTILVTWDRPNCIKKMNITWYDQSASQENYIDSIGLTTQTQYPISDVESYTDVMVCLIPTARLVKEGKSSWAKGERQCITESKETTTQEPSTSTTFTPSTTTSSTTTPTSTTPSTFTTTTNPSSTSAASSTSITTSSTKESSISPTTTVSTTTTTVGSETTTTAAPTTTTTTATTTTTTTATTATTETTTTPTATTSAVTTTKTTPTTKSTTSESTLTPSSVTSTETTDVTVTVTETTNSNGTANPTLPPEDNTALIVGLSVGIPVSLIAIAGVAYIIKIKFFGKTVEILSTSL